MSFTLKLSQERQLPFTLKFNTDVSMAGTLRAAVAVDRAAVEQIRDDVESIKQGIDLESADITDKHADIVKKHGEVASDAQDVSSDKAFVIQTVNDFTATAAGATQTVTAEGNKQNARVIAEGDVQVSRAQEATALYAVNLAAHLIETQRIIAKFHTFK